MNEKKIHQSLKNRYIVQLVNAFEDQSNRYLVTEFCQKGNLQKLSKNGLKQTQVKRLGLQIARGISYLHKNRIIHADLRADNILIDKDHQIKICDFGLALRLNEGKLGKNYIKNDSYTPPEAISSYDFALDIWMFGCLMHLMMSGRMPFTCNTWAQRSLTLTQKYLSTFKYDAKLPKQLIDMLKKIFVYDSQSRITIEQIINHSFFTGSPLKIPSVESSSAKQLKIKEHNMKIRDSLKSKMKSVELRSINKQNVNTYNIPVIAAKTSQFIPKKMSIKQQKIGHGTAKDGKSRQMSCKAIDQDQRNFTNYNVKQGKYVSSKRLSPLNTKNIVIKPIEVKTNIIEINKQGIIRRNAQLQFYVSSDGKKIRVKLGGQQKCFLLENLPEKYFKLYQDCKRTIQQVSAFTPKISFSYQDIDIKIMHNNHLWIKSAEHQYKDVSIQHFKCNNCQISPHHHMKIAKIINNLLAMDGAL